GQAPEEQSRANAKERHKVIACRGSVTDYRTDLKGVQPRGWPPGSTWDKVPGSNTPDKNEVVIAVIGHGNARFAARAIPLSCGARNKFEGYRIFVDNLKHGLDGRERQWLVKSESQVLRLAATLTYLNLASQPPSEATGLEMITAAMEPNEVT